MKGTLIPLRLNEFLCKVNTQLDTPHRAQFETTAAEHDPFSFSH